MHVTYLYKILYEDRISEIYISLGKQEKHCIPISIHYIYIYIVIKKKNIKNNLKKEFYILL